MIQFEISALDETLTEGGAYSFTVTPKAALSEKMDVRWVIVPKGKIPITKNDFSALEGTRDFAAGDTAAKTITITPTDDNRPEVSGEFAIQIYQVVAGGEDILLASQDVTLTDDEAFSGGDGGDFLGDADVNNFLFGNSSTLNASGVAGNDIYVISRYQTGDVTLNDLTGINIIRFDYGVEIISATQIGTRGGGKGQLLLGTDASSPTATVRWGAPADWQYQIGDSDVLLSWADFLEKLGLSSDGGALSTPYRVASLAGDSVAEGNYFGSLLSGDDADEVFAFGNDGGFRANGIDGDDIYVITRYQTGNVTLDDRSGTNIIKLDYGVQISSATKTTGRGSTTKGKLLLLTGTDASGELTKATVTWTKPANWQYQIGDGKVLDWSEFLTALGLSGNGGKLASSYNVGVLDITSNAEKIIFLQEGTKFVDTGAAIYTPTNIANKNSLEITWILAGADAALFEINEGSGAVTFKPSIPPATHVHVGAKYEFTIVATAGTQQAIKNVTIDVVNANNAPVITTETTTGSNKLEVSVVDGHAEVTTIDAMDADAGDILAFSLSGDDKNSFKIDASGELAFYDEPDFENPEDADGNNDYEVKVRVTDGNYDASGSSRDADTRYFKYSGGELSKAGDLVSVTAGTITKANGTMLQFAAKTGLNVEDDYSYIIVDDADNNGTYEVQLVAMLPDGDDYYALGEVAREDDELTTYEPYYSDTIDVEVKVVSVTDIA